MMGLVLMVKMRYKVRSCIKYSAFAWEGNDEKELIGLVRVVEEL